MFIHEFTYDGVLVRADGNGKLSHHAVAGKRQVKRTKSQNLKALPGISRSVPQ